MEILHFCEQKPVPSDADAIMAPKPPADPNRPLRRPPSRSRLLQHSQSYDGLAECVMRQGRSGSLTDSRARFICSHSHDINPFTRKIIWIEKFCLMLTLDLDHKLGNSFIQILVGLRCGPSNNDWTMSNVRCFVILNNEFLLLTDASYGSWSRIISPRSR